MGAAMAPSITPTAPLPTQQPNTENTPGGEQQKTWDRPPSAPMPTQKPITEQAPGAEQENIYDQWLDEQSSDSDTRICTEEYLGKSTGCTGSRQLRYQKRVNK